MRGNQICLHFVLPKHCLPESIFFLCVLVFFLPAQYTVSPCQLNTGFWWGPSRWRQKTVKQVGGLMRQHTQLVWPNCLVCMCGPKPDPPEKASLLPLEWWHVTSVDDHCFERLYLFQRLALSFSNSVISCPLLSQLHPNSTALFSVGQRAKSGGVTQPTSS